MQDTSTTMSRRTLLVAGLATAGLVGAGIAATSAPVTLETNGRPMVTTTIGMIMDVARNIGGEHVKVVGLMGPGIDPHLYKPSAGDIVRLGDADLILFGGLHLEGRMAETFERINLLGDKPTIAVSETIPEEHLIAVDDASTYDPHVWFDVTLWRIVGEAIAEALAAQFPEHAEAFAANAEAYLARFDELDAWVFRRVEMLAPEQRVLVTAHDAFGYFGRRYGFEVHGLQGLSTASEAGAGDVQDLAAFIAEREIRAIFVESSVPPSTVEAVRAACRARGWDVDIGGELLTDAMGEEGTREGTYIGMITHNVNTIVNALLGIDEIASSAPEAI